MRIFKVKPVKKTETTPAVANRHNATVKGLDKGLIAKKMRDNPTPSEALVSQLLTKAGIRFKSQSVMLGYIPDFYIKLSKTVLEVDGPIHLRRVDYDAHRDAVFVQNGFNVFRVTNHRVETEPDAVIQELRNHINHWALQKALTRQADRRKNQAKPKSKKAKRSNNKVEKWQDVRRLNKDHLFVWFHHF